MTRGASRWRRAIAPAVLVALAAVLVVSLAGSALIVTRPLEQPDAIVVLASHESERLPCAAGLARRYPSAQVWLTVPVRVTAHNCEDCADRVPWLTGAGVDARRIVLLPDRVNNTHDEAAAAAAFAADRQEPLRRLVIVTSPYHGRRALATFHDVFESAGVSTEIGIVTPVAHADPGFWWAHAMDRWYVTYEWAAITSYVFRYGIVSVLPSQEAGSSRESHRLGGQESSSAASLGVVSGDMGRRRA